MVPRVVLSGMRVVSLVLSWIDSSWCDTGNTAKTYSVVLSMAKSFSSTSLHVSASSLCRLYLPHYSGDSFWMRWPVSWPPFMPYFHGDFDHEDRTSGNRGLLRPGKEQEVLWKDNTGGCSFESKPHTAVTMAPRVTIIDICPISVLSHCSSFEILRQFQWKVIAPWWRLGQGRKPPTMSYHFSIKAQAAPNSTNGLQQRTFWEQPKWAKGFIKLTATNCAPLAKAQSVRATFSERHCGSHGNQKLSSGKQPQFLKQVADPRCAMCASSNGGNGWQCLTPP